MEKFGTVFKKLRESRHLSLADISKMGVSTSQISRFENGESDLTITKFIAILKKMNISIDEYLYVVNNFKRDDLSELLYQINKYLINHDAKGLKNLLVTYQEKTDDSIYHRLHILIIKIRLSFLNSCNQYELKDIKELSEYLFSVEYWGIYELLIFSSVIDVLEPQLYMTLLREMNRRVDFYKDIPRNKKLIIIMNINAYITCVEANDFISADYIEKQIIRMNIEETDLYERLFFKYAKNIYNYKVSKDEKYLEVINKIIAAVKIADSEHLAENFEEHLNKILQLNE